MVLFTSLVISTVFASVTTNLVEAELLLMGRNAVPVQRRLGGCCSDWHAVCNACYYDMTAEEYCREKATSSTPGCEKFEGCCQDFSSKCRACIHGKSEREYCQDLGHKVGTDGCEYFTTKPQRCCDEYHSECRACDHKITEFEFCEEMGFTLQVPGCEKFPGGGSSSNVHPIHEPSFGPNLTGKPGDEPGTVKVPVEHNGVTVWVDVKIDVVHHGAGKVDVNGNVNLNMHNHGNGPADMKGFANLNMQNHGNGQANLNGNTRVNVDNGWNNGWNGGW